MHLGTPEYLRSLASTANPMTYPWSQRDAMKAVGIETPAMISKLADLSFRAVLGMRAALGEWMYQRFLPLYDDRELLQVTEALWAASVDIRYLRREAMNFPSVDDNPIEGPTQMSKMQSKTISGLYTDAAFGAVRRLIGSANLVKYVLPDPKPFQKWFQAVAVRLPSLSAPSAREAGGFDICRKKTEPRGVPSEIFGTPIPREIFDPAVSIAEADFPYLINTMLVRVSSEPNPFLRSPSELAAIGFVGAPYRYPAQ